ncbi:MAG: hypothetical protein HY298_07500 [Verrucomicrobia bacterium]|nr:hypothetical protein [Verrucomicrobiota bacterium]
MEKPHSTTPARQGCLLIVDGHAYAYRAFHAIRQLTSPAGAPTNAIYGFIKMLGKMRDGLHPTHLVVVWDGGLAEERMAALPEYKAHRPPMPEKLESQLDDIVSYLQAANIASFCRDGVEADDWIATLARRWTKGKLENWSNGVMGSGTQDSNTPTRQVPQVVIASSDKDFMQLVSPAVGLLNPNDKSEAIWTAEQVRAKAGVEPSQIVDWLSLVGDSVDNIPGVPGVGLKTAAELLQQFGSVDGIYQRLAEIKSERLRTSLQAAAEAVRRNQKLIRLRDDLPGEFSAEELALRPADAARLRVLFADWGFKSLPVESGAVAEAQKVLF